jgi:hypothetical protein
MSHDVMLHNKAAHNVRVPKRKVFKNNNVTLYTASQNVYHYKM